VFSLSLVSILPDFFTESTPTIVGLPLVPTILVVLFLLLTTLTSGNGRAITLIVCVNSRIVSLTATIITMLTATGANILKMNRNTTAIANNHLLLPLSSTSYIVILPKQT
jgi:hypothetical protein